MPTLEQISTDVNSAKVYYVNKAAILVNNLKQGFGSAGSIKPLKRLIMALTFQINMGVVDADTETMYKCLLEATNGFVGDYSYDPSVKIPGETIIIQPGGYTPPSPLSFTQADLINGGTEDEPNYYLPFSATGVVPSLITVNGVSIAYTVESGYTPPRIYGFANNDTQTIIVNLTPGELSAEIPPVDNSFPYTFQQTFI